MDKIQKLLVEAVENQLLIDKHSTQLAALKARQGKIERTVESHLPALVSSSTGFYSVDTVLTSLGPRLVIKKTKIVVEHD